MKRSYKYLGLLCGVLMIHQTIIACSIFTCSKNGHVLVGANEDEYTSYHNMWFVPATKEKYGAVFFGKNNMQAQAGMNEYGLFFDFAAIPKIELENQKIDFLGMTEILVSCKNVDEALVLLEKHKFAAPASQMLMADASGKSVIVNAETIVPKTGNYQITTNFNICDLKDEKYDCLRYDKIDRTLSGANDISVSLFRDILDDVHQEGSLSTQYSNVYDLKNLKIYINWFHNYRETVTIDLKKELKKGFRIENLGSFFKQKNFAELTFERADKNYFYNLIINKIEKNGVDEGLKLFEQLVNAHPDKADKIKEDLNWVPYSLISKARIAYDNQPFDYYYVSFLNNHRTIWKSKNERLFQSLKILDYIKKNDLTDNDFHFHESLGYINMVLDNKEESIENYEKAIVAAKDGSWEKIRATNTLNKIKNTK
ncbi:MULTISPECIES: carcinine hydrolase/isopenicillin-N N-acyltransferase family protein [Flavobacteriaceae]|nr:carcinine hydrolase/isopenicillin-N N-acyltransferase family protein [Allomuricauda olearia]RUA30906.1 MAG: hypothetical protein DSY77_13505 [Bacteroidota bacterium]